MVLVFFIQNHLNRERFVKLDFFRFRQNRAGLVKRYSFTYELRNSYFKRLANIVCNFKTIPKTLTFRNQLTSLSHTIQWTGIRNVCVATHKLFLTTICSLLGAASISSRSSLAMESVYTSTKVVVLGKAIFYWYNVLLLIKCQVQHELQFGVIHNIIWIQEQRSILLFKKLPRIPFKSKCLFSLKKGWIRPECFFV